LASRHEIDRIIVVDDGSEDGTGDAARKAGAHQVVTLGKNVGKGAALTAGYRAAPVDVEIFLLLDADLGASATECVKLLPLIVAGEADMTVGTLPPDPALSASGAHGGGFGLVVRLARSGLLKRTGKLFEQPLSGQRAVRRSVIEAIGGKFRNGFGVEVGLTLAAMKNGFKVVEVPTSFRHRVTGHDLWSGLHRAQQLLDVGRVLMIDG
jgi:glycosyltransferase involved in cell wall biosynthesis